MDTQATKRILVGVDGSENAVKALVWAKDLGEKLGLPVTAACAWSHAPADALPGVGGPQRSAEDMDREVIGGLTRMIADAGLTDVNVRVLRGSASTALLQESSSPGTAMLIVGTRGLGSIPGLLLGSVSRRLLFKTVCPLILIPRSARDRPQLFDCVVIALDDSTLSRAIADWSAYLCGALDAQGIIVRCVEPGAELPPGRLDEIINRTELEVNELFWEPFCAFGVEYQSIVSAADPRRCILEVAEAHQAGLIVVGTTGAGRFEGLGGTASYLVRHSPSPLAVIPRGYATEIDTSIEEGKDQRRFDGGN